MSKIENKTENGSTESAGECTAGDIQDDKGLGLGVIFFIVAFVVCFLSGTLLFPKLLYSKKEQPFNFDHALHVEEAGDCDSCHSLREDGSYAGIPKLATCLDCHSEDPLGETEDEAVFVEEYVSKEKEVPWYIYSRQPDCVFFSHAAHLKGEKPTDCITCHGPIGESTSLKPYEENRITGYSRDIWGKNIFGIKKHSWDRMKMDDCAECHKKETGHQGYCFQCHK
ncbi:MAG: cytochrome c family protein [Proteobacteria bacterium]|nr:cytochrome c family protein [Pseudomonadota bacterium]MBU1584971.1 cytochrome c family protein [Pseudomonadota bacterium]MBU2455413.1 cytochrome c family protein [Pseudomonadota bacterium]MBU2630542.1 cytochrome c family protein [Pseudomonadota bacterium]